MIDGRLGMPATDRCNIALTLQVSAYLNGALPHGASGLLVCAAGGPFGSAAIAIKIGVCRDVFCERIARLYPFSRSDSRGSQIAAMHRLFMALLGFQFGNLQVLDFFGSRDTAGLELNLHRDSVPGRTVLYVRYRT